MHPESIRAQLAHRIASDAIAGIPMPLTTLANALDLGLDVDAIERRPHDHIIPTEELTNG